jgi:hypothetical protein
MDVDMNRAVHGDLRCYTIVHNIANRRSHTIATQLVQRYHSLASMPPTHAVTVGCRVPSPGNYHVPELHKRINVLIPYCHTTLEQQTSE